MTNDVANKTCLACRCCWPQRITMSTSTPASAPSAPAPTATLPTVARAQPHVPPPSTSAHTATPSIPFLGGQLLLNFGRLDSTYRRVNISLSIENQDSVARATYLQIEQLCAVGLPLTENQFIRMWKTLILKRSQDVYEQEKHTRAQDYVRVMRNLPVPGPLADLLYSIGQLHSRTLGTIFDIVPQPKPHPLKHGGP